MNRIPVTLLALYMTETGLVYRQVTFPGDCECRESPRVTAIPLEYPAPEEMSAVSAPPAYTQPDSAASGGGVSVTPGTGELAWTGFAPTVSTSSSML